MAACAICNQVYDEPLPYCSPECAAPDRAYVEDTGAVWRDARDLNATRARLAEWDARAADPTEAQPPWWATD